MPPAEDAAVAPSSPRPSRRGLVLFGVGYALLTLAMLYVATYRLEGTARFVLGSIALGLPAFVGMALSRRWA